MRSESLSLRPVPLTFLPVMLFKRMYYSLLACGYDIIFT
jgi:hypothetical protein